VLDDAFQGLPAEVQPVEAGVAALQLGHDPEGLHAVIEAAEGVHVPLQLVLPGVAERRVAEIVGHPHRPGGAGTEAHRGGHRAGDLGDLQRVRQPGAEMVAFVGDEDLRLLLQPPESSGVDDPVAIAGERGPRRALRFGDLAAPRGGGAFGVRRAGRGRGHPGLLAIGLLVEAAGDLI